MANYLLDWFEKQRAGCDECMGPEKKSYELGNSAIGCGRVFRGSSLIEEV